MRRTFSGLSWTALQRASIHWASDNESTTQEHPINRKTISTATLVATSLTAGMILGGCSNDPAPSNTTTVAAPTDTPPAPAESPVAEPTTPAAPAFEVGQKVSKKDAKNLPAGMTPYETTAGKLIVIDRKQPLPKAVTRDLDKKLVKAWAPGQGLKTLGNYGQLYADTYAATGKKPVIVGKAYLAPANDMWNHRELWSLVGPRGLPTDPNGTWNRDRAIKAAKKWIKEQSSPDEFVLLVQD